MLLSTEADELLSSSVASSLVAICYCNPGGCKDAGTNRPERVSNVMQGTVIGSLLHLTG